MLEQSRKENVLKRNELERKPESEVSIDEVGRLAQAEEQREELKLSQTAQEVANIAQKEKLPVNFNRLREGLRSLNQKLQNAWRRFVGTEKAALNEMASTSRAGQVLKEQSSRAGMDRRRFLRLAVAGTAAAVAARPLDALGESLKSALDPGGEDKLLNKVRKNKELNHEEKAGLAEALRSGACFRKIGEQIVLPDKEKLIGLYPGGGSHLALLEMADSMFKNKPKLREIEFRYTEISEIKKEKLFQNIKNLTKIDHRYSFDESEVKSETFGDKGKIFIIPIGFEGKIITIRYLLNCTGQEWFDKKNFAGEGVTYPAADFFVEHDSGSSLQEGLEVVMEALKNSSATKHTTPIVMEDARQTMQDQGLSSRHKKEERRFDLEFLGKIQRIPGFYGHRNEEFAYKDNEFKTETGNAYCTGGAIVEVHPELIGAGPEMIEVIFGCGIFAFGYGDNSSEATVKIKKMLNSGSRPIEVLREINPALADAFQVRQVAALLNMVNNRHVEEIVGSYSNSWKDGFTFIKNFVNQLEDRLKDRSWSTEAFLIIKKSLLDQEAHYETYLKMKEAEGVFHDYIKKNKKTNLEDAETNKLLHVEMFFRDEWLKSGLNDPVKNSRKLRELAEKLNKVGDLILNTKN